MRLEALLVAGFVGLGALAHAQGPEGPREGPGRGPRRGAPDPAELKAELGLSDEQVGQLRRLRLDQRKAAIRRHADLALARLGLEEALEAATVDEKTLQARIRELADLHAAELRSRVDGRLALRKILSAEQLDKLQRSRRERGPRRPALRPEGPDGGPPEPGPPGPRRERRRGTGLTGAEPR